MIEAERNTCGLHYACVDRFQCRLFSVLDIEGSLNFG